MNKFLILITLSFCMTLISPLQAKPLTKAQKEKLLNLEDSDLKKQMNQMIISIADLDILVNRDQVLEYEIFVQDADRILKAIAEIRKLDKTGVYKTMLDELETPTRKLKKLSLEKNKKALEVPKQIFNACFRCHETHRDKSSTL